VRLPGATTSCDATSISAVCPRRTHVAATTTAKTQHFSNSTTSDIAKSDHATSSKRSFELLVFAPKGERVKQTNNKEKIMKKSIRHFGAAVLLGAFVSLGPVAFGQVSVSETTTTTSGGTVTEFSPSSDTIVLKSETSSSPVTYSYSKSTTVVDENGDPVDVSIVKSGVPVQVIYAKEGDRMIARKIIVRKHTASSGGVIEKHEKTTTTETTQ